MKRGFFPFLLCGFCAATAGASDQLDGWTFSDTNWLSWSGYAPVAFTNLLNVRGGDGKCLELNSTNPAFLRYNVTEDDGTVEVSFGTGTVMTWFQPLWNSGDRAGTAGRLLEVGSYTTNASVGWWGLYLVGTTNI